MSLVPMLFSDWWEHLGSPHHLLGQNFGHGLDHDDLLVPHLYQDPHLTRHVLEQYARNDKRPRHTSYLRPWVQRNSDGGASVVKADKEKFNVSLDIQQFTPEEVTVKVVDRYVVVEGKHEEKQDQHGWISRQFTRKYLIPEQVDIDQVKSSLSSDGVLTITAPRKHVAKDQNERSIKIEHTGKPALLEHRGEKKEEKMEEKKEKKDKK